jgi:hypothetical protein
MSHLQPRPPWPALDDVMPRFDVRMRQSVRVHASKAAVFRAMDHLHATDMRLATLLGRIRSSFARAPLPRELGVIPPERPFFEAMGETGWVVVTRDDDHAIYGLVGRFWWRDFGLRFVTVDEYLRFREPGYAKIAFELRCEPAWRGVRLVAETRVDATDEDARRKFRRYWRLIALGARMTVRSMLKGIARRAEAS